MIDEKKLREDEARLHGAMKELLERSEEWTTEDESKWAELNTEYDRTRAELDKAEADRARRQRVDEIQAAMDRRGQMPPAPGDDPQDRAGDRRTFATEEQDRCVALQAWIRSQLGEDLSAEHREAVQRTGLNLAAKALPFELYRGQYDDVRAMRAQARGELRQQATTPGSAGGFTVPETMVRELEIALLDFSGMRQAADVMRTAGGNPMPWPTVNDTANEGGIVAENAEVTKQDMTFAQVQFGAIKFSSLMVLLSQELIEDNAVNLVSQLGRLLGERIGRRQNRSFTVGTGTDDAQGVTQAAVGKTAASATAITSDEVIDLVHSVDNAYRVTGASYQLHDSTVAAIRKLKGTDGQYIWQPGLQAGTPDLIYGFPYTVNNHMPTMAADAVTIAFGLMTKYKIRDVAQFRLRRLVERYADFDQEGFVAFLRSDGKILDAGTGPIKTLKMAAA